MSFYLVLQYLLWLLIVIFSAQAFQVYADGPKCGVVFTLSKPSKYMLMALNDDVLSTHLQ